MLSLRLVVDTNVVVSAALKPAGLQRTVFLIAITKPARLYVSSPMIEEYAEVLARPELRIRKGLRQQLMQLIRNRAHLVAPGRQLNAFWERHVHPLPTPLAARPPRYTGLALLYSSRTLRNVSASPRSNAAFASFINRSRNARSASFAARSG
jgi:hypothetical protein